MWEGKSRRCDPQVRTPGHWDVPYAHRRERRRGGLMLARLRFPVSTFLFVLVTATCCVAQNAPTPDAYRRFTSRSSSRRPAREMPESKVGASITVLDREQIEQRHALSTIDLLRNGSRRRRGAIGRRRQPDRRVRARRRIDLQQSAARRHAAERAWRRLQLRVAVAGKHRAHRSAARRAFGALRIGRDGQRHSAVLGAARRAAGRS